MSVIIKGGGNNVLTDVDSQGNLMVTLEGQKATYRAAGAGGSIATSNTYVLIGSATKKVKLVRAEVNCNFTSTGLVQLLLKKYSTLPTGGTSSLLTAVPVDSTDPAATGIVRAYTAAPTEGTLVGSMGSWVIAFPVNSTASFANPINVLNFSAGAGEKPITLNSANEYVGFNFNAAVFANVTLIWTEE